MDFLIVGEMYPLNITKYFNSILLLGYCCKEEPGNVRVA